METEILVGVSIADQAGYQRYRDRMTPMLEAAGGRFVIDLEVSRVLRAPAEGAFNRVFTIRFADEAAMDAFFSDPTYQRIRDEDFDSSVNHFAVLATYRVAAEG